MVLGIAMHKATSTLQDGLVQQSSPSGRGWSRARRARLIALDWDRSVLVACILSIDKILPQCVYSLVYTDMKTGRYSAQGMAERCP